MQHVTSQAKQVFDTLDSLGQESSFPETLREALNCTNEHFQSVIEVACNKNLDSALKKIIELRKPFSDSEVEGMLDSWIIRNRDHCDAKDNRFIDLVSQLTWSNMKDLLNFKNLQKYYSHLNHLSGAVIPTVELPFEKVKELSSDGLPNFLSRQKELDKYNLIGWFPQYFLPIRIHLFILIYFEVKNKNTPIKSAITTTPTEVYAKKIIHQITLDLELLKQHKTQLWINSLDSKTELREHSIRCLANQLQKDGNESVLCSGFKGHTFYIHFLTKNSSCAVSIYNAGALVEYHPEADINDHLGNPYRFPYVFHLPVAGNHLFEYLHNVWLARYSVETVKVRKEYNWKEIEKVESVINPELFADIQREINPIKEQELQKKEERKKQLVQEIKPLIYTKECEKIDERTHPRYGIQISGNCVVASHDVLVLQQLGSRELFDDFRQRENSQIKIILPSTKMNIGSLEMDKLALEANMFYDEGQEYERGGKNWAFALEKYEIAAKYGHIGAKARLGYLFFNGLGCDVNIPDAIRLLEFAANEMHSFAQLVLAEAYKHGIGVSPNPSEAVMLLEQAVAAGNVYARFYLSLSYKQGIGTKQNFQRAHHLLLGLDNDLIIKAGEGDVLAAYILGSMYGADGKIEESISWLKKSSEWGFVPALTEVACYTLNARPTGIEFLSNKDDIMAFKCLKGLAKKGYYLAQYRYGLFSLQASKLFHGSRPGSINGMRVPIYEREAFTCFEKSASNGFAPSWHQLGLCYKENRGINPINKVGEPTEKLLELLRISNQIQCFKEGESRNHPSSTFELALCYINALPGLQNYNHGFKLMKKAIRLGSYEAMLYLADLYREGKQCIKDISQSNRYLQMVAFRLNNGLELYMESHYKEAFEMLLMEKENLSELDNCANKKYVGHLLGNVLYMLAVCYWNGEGVQMNQEQAIYYLKMASRQKNSHASLALAEYSVLEGKIDDFYEYEKLSLLQKYREREAGLLMNHVEKIGVTITGFSYSTQLFSKKDKLPHSPVYLHALVKNELF